jgi:hypothetical protein
MMSQRTDNCFALLTVESAFESFERSSEASCEAAGKACDALVRLARISDESSQEIGDIRRAVMYIR